MEGRNILDPAKETTEESQALRKIKKKAFDILITLEKEEANASQETAELVKRLGALAERTAEDTSNNPSGIKEVTGADGSSVESELTWDYSADRESPRKPEETDNESVFEAVSQLELEIPSPTVDKEGHLV